MCKYYCKICEIYLVCDSPSKIIVHDKSVKHLNKLERKKLLEESDGDTITIPLKNNKGNIRGYTVVDKDIYPLIMMYAIQMDHYGYACISINNKSYKLHRYIYYNLCNNKLINNTIIDHIDRKRLNNKLENLRQSTNADNAKNKSKLPNKTSKFYGVSLSKDGWRCELRYDGTRHIFYYKNELHAAYHRDLLIKEFNMEKLYPLNNISEPDNFVQKTKNKQLHQTKKQLLNVDIKTNQNKIGRIIIYNRQKEIIGKALVDWDIYEYIKLNKLHLRISGGYILITINSKTYRLHRWIMKYDGKLIVDHIDNDRCNNTRNNLRITNYSKNAQNKKAHKNTSSKYVGISHDKRDNTWKASIQREYLGAFQNEKLAVIARNNRAEELNALGAFYKIEYYGMY
jgi:hypothetical protein